MQVVRYILSILLKKRYFNKESKGANTFYKEISELDSKPMKNYSYSYESNFNFFSLTAFDMFIGSKYKIVPEPRSRLTRTQCNAIPFIPGAFFLIPGSKVSYYFS